MLLLYIMCFCKKILQLSFEMGYCLYPILWLKKLRIKDDNPFLLQLNVKLQTRAVSRFWTFPILLYFLDNW